MKVERVQCPVITFGCSARDGYIVKGDGYRGTVEIEVSFPQRRSAYVVSYREFDCIFTEVFSSDSFEKCKEYARKLAEDIAMGCRP